MKLQQCTGPIMAKGLEDTAFYIFNRLVALNEVGGEPQRFGCAPEDFHHFNEHNAKHWPHTMLASSTHDTKRAEDARARIAALSELPIPWRQALRAWSALNRRHKTDIEGEEAPNANEEYLLYQILLGTWPERFGDLPEAEHAIYVQRIADYMTKAINEAKVNSSWIQPNDAWVKAVRHFIEKILHRAKAKTAFWRVIQPLADQVAQLGAINSLSQTMLKLTVPGVPDIYQGNELWDYSLVDPDNRRPVDYALRKRLISKLDKADPAELLRDWRDGRIKLFITRAILRFRSEQPDLFAHGDYHAVKVTGEHAHLAVAFERVHEGQRVLIAVPRLTAPLGFPPVGDAWKDTALAAEGGEWRELLTGRKLTSLSLASLFADFPFAVLTPAI